MKEILNEILTCKSISVVGLAKNTGKTETLNYILRQLSKSGKNIAVTSIGLDGEQIDQIFGTTKPEITIYKGMIFNSVEKFFAQRNFEADVLNISRLQTSLGRVITARAIETGKIILSGAADTQRLRKIIAQNAILGADITIVDGATSRLSLASPAITDALILATGTAYSANIEQLVKKTRFVCNLINLETNILIPLNERWLSEVEITNSSKVFTLIDNELYNLQISSSLMINKISTENLEKIRQSKNLVIFGIVSDNLINFLRLNIDLQDFILIAQDFTKIFISPQNYNIFTKKGGKINVMHRPKLLAVTINPTSPEGITLHSETLQAELRKNIDAAVFDIRKI
jgi:hypothetical protein